MRDPFPAPAPLVQAFTPIASRLSLRTLPFHVHEILPAFAFYNFINLYVSPVLSRAVCPKTYPSLSERTRKSWDSHVVSLVQSTIITAAAGWVIYNDHERWNMSPVERVWGYTGSMGLVQALSAGYFLWDLITSALQPELHHSGAAAHATAALAISMFGFRPFCNYYGINFILFELSTPFLNFHWFMDKLGMTGSTAQLINGGALITSFAGCRILWGNYQTVRMFRDIWEAYHTKGGLPVPLWLAMVYMTASGALATLNAVWFVKMIGTLMARFEKKPGADGKNGRPKAKKHD